MPTLAKPQSVAYLLGMGIVLGSVIVANYYAEDLASLFHIQPWWIAILSGVTVIMMIVGVWHRERNAELLRYEFLTIATHKFRTPLTRIKWGVNNLRKDLTHDERIATIKAIEAGNDRLIETIDILIGVAKVDNRSTYIMKAASFREMIEQILDKYAQKIRDKEIKLTIQEGDNVPMITIDTKKIQFVIEVLIQNALTYTPKGGEIGIATKLNKNSIMLIVEDTGIGITKRNLKKIFKPFIRSKKAQTIDTEGMGMGLYISQRIIKRHKGRIWAESEGPDKGSAFYIELPIT